MKYIPNVYIMGTQKSGTTTLYDWLAQHPQVYAHELGKDYPFFENSQCYQEGRKQFQSFFEKGKESQVKLGGGANAMYAQDGASRMAACMPDAKLIVILRNPVNRAYSAYCYAKERCLENRSFEEATQEEMDGKVYLHEEEALQKDYLKHGLYASQLKRVYQYFSKDQVKIIVFEEMLADTPALLKEVFQFMGIGSCVEIDTKPQNTTLGGSRYPWLSSLIYASPSSKTVRKFAKAIIPFSVRTMIRRRLVVFNRVQAEKPHFPNDLKRELHTYYQEEINGLEDIMGRSIPQWKPKD